MKILGLSLSLFDLWLLDLDLSIWVIDGRMGFFYVLTLTRLLIFGFGNLIELCSGFSSSKDLLAWSGTYEEEEETKGEMAVRPRAAIFFSSQKRLKK